MEIILAIVVVMAVIFFGALISMGNERQRKAIDNLREQILLWAIQDLHIKREQFVGDIKVDDPIGWINKVGSKACGNDLRLQVIESFDEPPALICSSGDTARKVIFTPLSPSGIRRAKRDRRSRLSQYVDRNPLLYSLRGTSSYELSVLNSGVFFDFELPLAWKGLTGKSVNQTELLWMYIMI